MPLRQETGTLTAIPAWTAQSSDVATALVGRPFSAQSRDGARSIARLCCAAACIQGIPRRGRKRTAVDRRLSPSLRHAAHVGAAMRFNASMHAAQRRTSGVALGCSKSCWGPT
eukprot:3118653-Pleurochrysis_carterae.AAC.1